MADITFTLGYSATHEPVVVPAKVKATKGQTMTFQLAPGTTGEVLISFEDPEFFSVPQFRTGDKDVVVVADLSKVTAFECSFTTEGTAGRKRKIGGHVEPQGR